MIPLLEFLRDRKVRFAEGGADRDVRHGWVGMVCPWCGSSGKRYLGIRLADGYSSCWSCGRKRLGDVLTEVAKVPLGEAIEVARGVRKKLPGKVKKARGRLKTPTGVGPMLAAHRKYLAGRGFDPGALEEEWGLRGIGPTGRCKWRVFIPVELHGTVVSWMARSIGTSKPRYMSADPSCEEVPRGEVLYGAGRAGNAIVVCEGPADAWAVGPGGVATMGLNVSPVQFLEIAAYPVRVICFDSEPKAKLRAESLANKLKALPGETYHVVLETGKDAGEADPDELLELRMTFGLAGPPGRGLGKIPRKY